MLWHGTGETYTASIDANGLLAKGRLYVHLSADEATARKVGGRHGRVILYKVHSGAMARDGLRFWRSANGVWLCRSVPVNYLEKQEDPS